MFLARQRDAVHRVFVEELDDLGLELRGLADGAGPTDPTPTGVAVGAGEAGGQATRGLAAVGTAVVSNDLDR